MSETGASIPIPGRQSLCPVKNKKKGNSADGVWKIAITRGTVFFSSKCTRNRLAVGLCSNMLQELSAPTDSLAGLIDFIFIFTVY